MTTAGEALEERMRQAEERLNRFLLDDEELHRALDEATELVVGREATDDDEEWWAMRTLIGNNVLMAVTAKQFHPTTFEEPDSEAAL